MRGRERAAIVDKELPHWAAGVAVLERVREAAGEEWTSRFESRTPAFLKVLSLAAERVAIVTGELRPVFFEQKQMIRAFRQAVEKGVELAFLFDKPGTYSPGQAEQVFLSENPHLADLKREHLERLRLYWTSRRPRLQFMVVDGKHTMHEEPDHITGVRPATINRYDDPTWAAIWERKFREVVEKEAQEILRAVEPK